MVCETHTFQPLGVGQQYPGVFLQRYHIEKFPCGNGPVEIVPCRSLMVCTIRTSPPIVISYLIDRRYLSSIALLELAPVCLHAMSVLGGATRGELVCHRPVPMVISPMSPYCVWCSLGKSSVPIRPCSSRLQTSCIRAVSCPLPPRSPRPPADGCSRGRGMDSEWSERTTQAGEGAGPHPARPARDLPAREACTNGAVPS